MYNSPDQPLPKGKLYKLYLCPTCSQFHAINWGGDCRDDANRHESVEAVDAIYGPFGWEEVPPPNAQ